MKKCCVCGDEAMELHHIWPISLGGPKEGHVVPLCGNCHSKIHTTANSIYKGKGANEPAEWLAKAKPLIERIIRAKIESESLSLDNALVPIIFKVPKRVRDLMHRRKLDHGTTSLIAYIIKLIHDDIKRS